MTYVIRTRITELADKHFVSSDYLMEMSADAARKAEASDEPGVEYNIIPASLAHRYVRNGMTHETPLYINADGKIRRA